MPLKCETHILQNLNELNAFLRIVKDEGVRSYLEIGCKNGGSLWRIGRKLPAGSRIVAVDLPQADKSFKNTKPNLIECVEELRKQKYDVHLFLGDSTDQAIVSEVRQLSPFDLCLIDANHTEPYVWQDWQNYGQMSRIVAFHDISAMAHPPDSKKMPIEVPAVWNQLKQNFAHKEIKYETGHNGIGVLWRNSQPL